MRCFSRVRKPAPYFFGIGKHPTENGADQMVSAMLAILPHGQEVPVTASGFEETGGDPLRFLLH
jgi:hypothetical protein